MDEINEIKKLKEAEENLENDFDELIEYLSTFINVRQLGNMWPFIAIGVLGTLAVLNIDQIWHFWWVIFFIKPLLFGWFGWHPFGKGCTGKNKVYKKGEYV